MVTIQSLYQDIICWKRNYDIRWEILKIWNILMNIKVMIGHKDLGFEEEN